MTSSSAAAATRRLVLVPSGPRADRGDDMVRRYRLARLRLEGRAATQHSLPLTPPAAERPAAGGAPSAA